MKRSDEAKHEVDQGTLGLSSNELEYHAMESIKGIDFIT